VLGCEEEDKGRSGKWVVLE